MKVGFTGTQQGMSEGQKRHLEKRLIELDPEEFHHGDCVGADLEAHAIASILGIKTVVHPPLNARKRAWCAATVILPPREYLERNRNIVHATDYLFVAPRRNEEELRSGTWATFRYAKLIHDFIEIIER